MADPYSTAMEEAMEPLRHYSSLMGMDPFTGGMLGGQMTGGSGDVDVRVSGGAEPAVNPATGAINIPQENGDVVIQFPGVFHGNDDADDSDHDANLAEGMDPADLNQLAEDVLSGIEEDERGRSNWLSDTEKGITLLAMKVEGPRNGTGDSTAPIEGMSSIRSSLLQEAVLRFQANARGELLPADGPVKVKSAGPQTIQSDRLAAALEQAVNVYLTKTAKEYYPDTDKLLFGVGFRGCGFKKVFHDPIKRRPVSESVDAKDLIVPANATDLSTAIRITHRVAMPHMVLRKMQLDGVYLDKEIGQPTAKVDPVTAKQNNTQGLSELAQRPEDINHTIYECYTYRNLPGFEDADDDGEETGLPLPYRITIDRDSREVLEVRRNWRKDDATKTAKRVFVKYSFVPAFGFYDLGLLNILGNATEGLTAAIRIALDAGMFANFPGFVYSKQGVNRQPSNEFRIPPGGGMGLDTGQMSIRDAVMPMPYHEPGGTFIGVINKLESTAQRVGGTAETNVGEGKQDAPVGTTLALIEQATKIMDAVHKRLHQAQAEEFQLLRELFIEDPEALWRHNDKAQVPRDADEIVRALNDFELIPVADPNVPSSMHRHAKIAALMQLVVQFPALFNIPNVLDVVLRDMKWSNPQELLAPPQTGDAPPSPQDLAAISKIQAAQQKSMLDQAKLQQGHVKMVFDADQAEKDRRSKEDLAILQLANTQVIHPLSAGIASNPALPRQIQRTQP